MRRREFITLLGGAAADGRLAARAQQAERMRRIGVLQGGGDTDDPRSQPNTAAFLQALQQLGWTDGRNVKIDYRWPAGDADKSSQIRGGTGRACARRHSGFQLREFDAVVAGNAHRADCVRGRRRSSRRRLCR